MKAIKRLLRKYAAVLKTPVPAPQPTPGPLKAASGKRRVILFIGHHKVGSTSLQDYLARNAPALLKAGILYPFVDFEGSAYMAAAAAGHRAPEGSLPINVREPHNALAFRMMAEKTGNKVPGYHRRLPARAQMFNAIDQQIRFTDPHTVILAAEVFANFNATAPELIRKLARHFEGAEFTVVATLRRIDEYLASWQGQRLKFGHQLDPLRNEGLAQYLGGIHFDYRLMVEGWLKALPKAEVILRDYADVRAAGGSVADFITQTGLDLPEGLAPERRENDSLHRGIYEIVRRGNIDLGGALARTLRNDLRAVAPDLGLPSSNSIELFGAEVRAQMLEQFRPMDSYLGQVMGREGFFADLEAVGDPAPVPEMEAYAQALEALKGHALLRDPPQFADFADGLRKALETPSGAAA